MSTLAPFHAPPPARRFPKTTSLVVVTCILLTLGIGLLASVTTTQSVANRDYIEYWAAGQQLVHGANPYAADQIFTLERSQGKHAALPLILLNPPTALALTLPLGTVRPKTGYLLWSVFIIGSWIGSIHLLWTMNGRPKNSLHFTGYFFAPAISCFLLGQMAAFALLGVTLFLYFHRTKPLLAGAALFLCALKPHLFLPLASALLAWTLTSRHFRVLAGATGAIVLSAIVPLFFDPPIYLQYAAMARTSNIGAAFIPTWDRSCASTCIFTLYGCNSFPLSLDLFGPSGTFTVIEIIGIGTRMVRSSCLSLFWRPLMHGISIQSSCSRRSSSRPTGRVPWRLSFSPSYWSPPRSSRYS